MTTRRPKGTNGHTATSWHDFRAVEPAFAAVVEKRFGLHKHHVLATLRADGAPRLTGLEVDFRAGELWLGMMPGSRKALDLRRDPRFSVYANPGPGAEMEDGDARVAGRAIEVKDPGEIARWAAAAPEGEAPEVFHLFRVEVTEVVRVSIEMPDIVLRTWKPGHPLRTLRRGNDEAPAREDGVS